PLPLNLPRSAGLCPVCGASRVPHGKSPASFFLCLLFSISNLHFPISTCLCVGQPFLAVLLFSSRFLPALSSMRPRKMLVYGRGTHVFTKQGREHESCAALRLWLR